MRLWNPGVMRPDNSLDPSALQGTGGDDGVKFLGFDATGRYLIAVHESSTLRMWDFPQRRQILQPFKLSSFLYPYERISEVNISDDSKTILVLVSPIYRDYPWRVVVLTRDNYGIDKVAEYVFPKDEPMNAVVANGDQIVVARSIDGSLAVVTYDYYGSESYDGSISGMRVGSSRKAVLSKGGAVLGASVAGSEMWIVLQRFSGEQSKVVLDEGFAVNHAALSSDGSTLVLSGEPDTRVYRWVHTYFGFPIWWHD